MSGPIYTLDFETHAIDETSRRAPEPVGLAIKDGAREAEYLAWGHPSDNNCSKERAGDILRHIWRSGRPILFHNMKFDLRVVQDHFNLPLPAWERLHDTMFLAYLCDPHLRHIDLKSLANDLLGEPPEERDIIEDWVWDNRFELIKQYGGRVTRTKCGAWISRCPVALVGPYAVGDVERTYRLYNHLWPIVEREGMSEAYARERRVFRVFYDNEARGIRVDTARMARDIPRYQEAKRTAEIYIQERLGAPNLNLDADQDVAEALTRAGMVDDDKWKLTETGRKSMAKTALLPHMFNDPLVASAMGYRNRMCTVLGTFLEPWAEQSKYDGRVRTSWHQTRGGEGGTRTGRPATSSPNLLNISKNFEGRGDGYVHPEGLDLPPLPLVREFMLPEPEHLWLHRDFDGQELRIYAHFEGGDLFERYKANPRFKPHDYIKQVVEQLTGREFDKTVVKNINFGKIYGAGVSRLAGLLGVNYDEAKKFDAIHNKAMPSIVLMKEEILRLSRRGTPLRTWGGRLYYAETPAEIDGRMRTFEYKLLNYLIQGSAADATKEAICRWWDHPKRDPEDHFLVTIYDENNISAHKRRAKEAMGVLRECMEGLEFDVKMLSAPKAGKSWGACVKPNDGEDEDAFISRMCAA